MTEMSLDNNVRDFLLSTTVLSESNLELPGARNSSESQKLSNREAEAEQKCRVGRPGRGAGRPSRVAGRLGPFGRLLSSFSYK